MSEKSTIVRSTLDAIEGRNGRGEDRTREQPPEADSLGEEFWKAARVRMPTGKTPVQLRVDTDVLEWFKSQGAGHLTRMNAVLRAYVDTQRRS